MNRTRWNRVAHKVGCAWRCALTGTAAHRTALARIATSAPLSPGLYHVEVAVSDAPWHPRATTTGFWVADRDLLRRGPRLEVSRDWLRRDGRPFPVVGTTYMASDVHRKFLFEPNPHVWDRDFPASPSLVTITKDGQTRDVVAQIAKNGRLYVLDRDSGAPLYPMQEIDAPPSDVPGEQTAPRQILPTLPWWPQVGG